MPTPDAASFLAALPPDAREAFTLAAAACARIGTGDTTAGVEFGTLITRATALVELPQGADIPVDASGFTDVQRAALAWTALAGLPITRHRCPWTAWTRLRWLGLAPPGVLERHVVEVARDGTTVREPLWRALRLAGDVFAQRAILDALPMETALAAMSELWRGRSGYGVDANALFATEHRLLTELRDEGRAWALAEADDPQEASPWRSVALDMLVLFALVRAGVPIEPRWDRLFAYASGLSRGMLFECARAIPAERRARVLAAQMKYIPWAIETVDDFPSAEVVAALLARVEPRSTQWEQLVAALRPLGATHAIVGETVEAIVAATPAPIELVVTRSVKPKRAADLSPLEREQLRIGGRGWDQQDLPAEARLADDDGSETSFKGFLEIRTIAGADGVPCYDALLYMAGAGAIFRAGTTDAVGWLSDGGVVLETPNDPLRIALGTAVGPAPRKPAKKAPAKRPPRKKA